MKLSYASTALTAMLALDMSNGFSLVNNNMNNGRVLSSSSSSSSSCLSRNNVSSRENRRCDVMKVQGIMDEVNSDAFDLTSLVSKGDNSGSGGRSAKTEEAYEMFLAELVFSPNDPRMDIVENYERVTDEDWRAWLLNKIGTSTDPEEKLALRDLNDMIEDVTRKIEVSRLAEQRAVEEAQQAEKERLADAVASSDEGRTLSDTDLLRKANTISQAGISSSSSGDDDAASGKKSFLDSELTADIRMSYEDMVKKVMPPYAAGDTPASIIFTYYDQFDAQFIKVLNERKDNGDSDATALLEALSIEQQKRLTAATESLKAVLAAGDPMRMEGVIVKMAREGNVDEPFLLLLEANANQARAAGANGPAQLMERLRVRASDEKDKQSSTKEVTLLRKLLRANDSAQREQLLEDAFTPKDMLLVPGTPQNAQKALEGEAPDEEKPMPDVPPPDFINACKAVLLNFGNLATDDDRGDLSSRIKQIAAEAEVVATRIYGKGMSPKEQQDRMWKEQTTSIFDLETMEIDAEKRGDAAPWTNPDNDDILPGFDPEGRMKIGG
uniref:Uncharacterized protein n=1 Tax=Eucampia antarctica TaxID=49252 RepID=A0A7S2S3D9_9STRA|mmetsp:Transcript_3047/g.2933  ORF Transcript_3047/g.2933 Transcript_3047/m.2933 type:complete len:554 (+) Transcript_3047:80-1741(+)